MRKRPGCGELILRELYERDPKELSQKNPMVLSCGGIYIPRKNRKSPKFEHHLLTTPNDSEPTKVVSGIRPKNILKAVMDKEDLN